MSTASQKSQSRHRPCKQLRLQYYDEAIHLYYEGRLSYGRIGKELGFSRSTIAEWISNFAATNPETHAQMKKGAGPTPEDYAKLQAEVARLQKALNAGHMRAEFYDTMIDVAEEMFKISIRKNWPQAVSSPHAKKRSEFTVSGICRLFGVSRQSYYKHNDGLLLRRLAREEFVVQFVEEVRQLDPGIGGKKLWLMHHQRFGNQHAVGRDCFYDILDTHSLKVRRRMRKPRTTDSTHGLSTFPNLARSYIPEAKYPQEASRMRLRHLSGDNGGLIHHSDRGCQYASYVYAGMPGKNGISVSMAESGDPKENTMAERINSTIKQARI